MIQESFADCSAVGTSHRDNPVDLVPSLGEITNGLSWTYPWRQQTIWGPEKATRSFPCGRITTERKVFTREGIHIDLREFWWNKKNT